MKKIIFVFTLLVVKNYTYAKDIYSYEDILSEYSYFEKSLNFDGILIIDDEKYLKDPNYDPFYSARFKDKNLTVIGTQNVVIINNKKFNIRALPGIGKYKKDDLEWRTAHIYKNNKSFCIENTHRGANNIGQRFRQIILVENYLKPKPYYFRGLFLNCTYLRKIKNKFYVPSYEIFGSKYNRDGETVKFNYRQISPGFPIKYKYEGKFPNTENVFEFELTKSEIIK